jgi:DNA-binding NtrC family response regulator
MNKTVTVCVIDDDHLVRRTMCEALETAGFTTVEAADGNAGIKAIETSKADIAVIDIIMPSREGLDVIVEATQRFPQLKILAVSGGGQMGPTDYLELAHQLGAHDTLAKPFRNADFVEKVKRLA